MNIDNTIHIVLASDNHYVILVAVLIKSIEINHKSSEKLAFTIMDDGISDYNKNKLQNTINPKTTNLNWVDAKTVIPLDVKIPQDNSTLPYTTYLRLFSPYVVDNCKKIIYMDVDMIAYDDISNLYNIDIGENIIAAVQDYQGVVSSPNAIKNYKELGLDPETKYFNAGLLLINTEKWIENNIAKKAIECMNNNINHVLFADQYGLNVILHNKWQQISLLWNCSDYFEIPSNPSIVHFLNIKPIFKSCPSLQRHKDEFYRMLSLTPFKNFKPKSDYHRLFKKGFTKVKKILQLQ